MISPPAAASILSTVILNDVQREAVTCPDGPQLVFAGAGTGKTRVLTAKIAYLIEHHRILPGNIFAATFTNKAAREMQRRVEDLTAASCKGLWIGTFHSLCARILRREAGAIGYQPSFSIYDSDDQLSLVKKTAKELKLDERTMPPRLLLHSISNYKNACISWQELEAKQTNFFEQETIKVYAAYQKSLLRLQAMDFDDLITNCVYLFRKNNEVLCRYQHIFKYVLVDEYQDTNRSQFNLVKLLAQQHRNIFVVGDDDQSIYGWRGAEIQNILSFEKVFPGAKTFTLEQNYRSTQSILNFANEVIASNTCRAQKRLWTSRQSGSKVTVSRYRDDRHEASAVAEGIERSIRGGVKGGDIAILFRTNAQSRLFEESLRKRRIPYVLVGGTGFYERKEIKDCCAYLRLLVNPKDDISCGRILNVPPRGIGEKAREVLSDAAQSGGRSLLETLLDERAQWSVIRGVKGIEDFRSLFSLLSELNASGAPPDEILKQTLTLTGYLDMLEDEESEESNARIENVGELVNAVTAWAQENPDKGLSAFLEEVALASDVDKWNKSEDTVNCMTLHCAKGLEFKKVFIVGCEDGIIPSRQNCDDDAKLEEERRLLYVGATRAMESLDVAWADQRLRFGSIMSGAASRFLRPVSAQLYQFADLSAFVDVRVQAPRPVAQPVSRVTDKPARGSIDDFSQETVQYRVGQRVIHKLYGNGEIISLSGFGVDMHMTVKFNDGSKRRMMAQFANFEQV